MTIKTLAVTTAIVAAGTSTAFAGGLDRVTFSSAILFEKGTYAEIAYAVTSPKVSHVPSGSDIAQSFNTGKLGFKMDLGSKFAVALMFNNQPVGADINYVGTPIGPGLLNPQGVVDASVTTLLGKYQITEAFSAYAGVKYQEISGVANLAVIGSASANFASEGEYGYIAGVAYEIPEIALRVALSYESKIEYDLPTTNLGGVALGTTSAATPEAWTLEFQSGVAPKTLVFGSIRHALWADANITVPDSATPLTSFSDTQTYTIGVGRKFSDAVSGSFSVFYEAKEGDVNSLFAPTDGVLGVSFGTKVSVGQGVNISGGISYSKRGNSPTAVPGLIFSDNSVTTVGVKVSKTF